MKCTIGSAYVALHEMSDPPRSWTITPIGQTDRRDLPYHTAATELFATRTSSRCRSPSATRRSRDDRDGVGDGRPIRL